MYLDIKNTALSVFSFSLKEDFLELMRFLKKGEMWKEKREREGENERKGEGKA